MIVRLNTFFQLFFISFLALPYFLHGQCKMREECPCVDETRLSRIYVGPQVSSLELQIRQGPHLALHGAQQNVTLNGVLGGVIIGYEYKSFHALYAALLTDWLAGTISKKGVPSRKINDLEAEVRIGYNYQALQGKKWVVTPYLGFGFNYISQKQSSPPSFKYYEYYLPLGFIVDYMPKDWFTVELNFQWRPALDSTVRVSTIAGSRFTLKKKHSQYWVEMPFIFHLGEKRNWDISLVPFWKRKKDGATKNAPGGIPLGLPKQSYTYAGGYVTIGYRF